MLRRVSAPAGHALLCREVKNQGGTVLLAPLALARGFLFMRPVPGMRTRITRTRVYRRTMCLQFETEDKIMDENKYSFENEEYPALTGTPALMFWLRQLSACTPR